MRSLKPANSAFAFSLACLLPISAVATSVERRSLAELIRDSDHVVIATVAKVDMVDGKSMEIKDRNARTGPGLENEIRFHLEVKEVLFSTAASPPKRAIVRLWKSWHYSLGDIQDAVAGNTSIFLLKGRTFDPVYPAYFERPLREREQIEKLLSTKVKRR
jgi:hypothetical protein